MYLIIVNMYFNVHIVNVLMYVIIVNASFNLRIVNTCFNVHNYCK